jgi:GT2 family glycosyltransferase
MTLDCLASIARETHTSHEIIVVDNCSIDGSAEAIANRFPDVKLRRSPRNLGFARANNLAATEARGEYLLLLNPDTVVLDGAIDRLVVFADDHKDAGIWGGRTVYADGSLNPTSCWGRMTLWSLFCRSIGLTALFRSSEFFNPEGYGDWKRDSMRRVDIVTGCLLLIRKSLWQALAGFDVAYFMYGEEADLCLRAQTLGACPLLTPTATIIHYGSASDPHRPDKDVAILRAQITTMRRHWPPLHWRIGKMILFAVPVLRVVAYGLAAYLSRRGDIAKRASAWSEIWARRSQWMSGYESV